MKEKVSKFYRDIVDIQNAHSVTALPDYFLLTIRDRILRLTWTKDPGSEVKQKVKELAEECGIY